ncbi:FKBP12-associated protein, partial [Exophiala xenobiotica]
RKKEEVRCNARANMPEPSGRQTCLKCDDECARLERNRNLAMALHISDDHTDDHVPYSTTTLKMYLEDVAWAHKQEEVLRLFAADDTEKRYRFQPMRSRQRAFIHSLAEDFGFDGESLDPEPHRHVLLFKTPKFVAAPMKTLAQAARIKRAQLNVAAPVHSAPERKADEVRHEYNGLLLTKPKFALTEEELRPVVRKAAPTTEFDIVFLSNDEGVALLPSMSWETPEQLVTLLTSLQPTMAAEVTRHNLAASVVLCQFESSGLEPKIIQQHGKPGNIATNGWSQVAAKRAAPIQAPQVKPVGQKPVYTVLGSRLAEAKRKKQENEEKLRRKAEEQVVDDWEKEVEKEESDEAERRVSHSSEKEQEQEVPLA